MGTSISYQKLRAKLQIFVTEYAKTNNKTLSAIKAGYNEARACKEGIRLLKRDDVIDMLEVERARLRGRVDVSDRRLFAEIGAIGFGNICDLTNEDGTLKPLNNLPEATQRAIKSIKIKNVKNEDGEYVQQVVGIEMHPKLPALQLLVAIKGLDDSEASKETRIKIDIKGLGFK